MDMVGKVRAALYAALREGESGLGGVGTAYVLDVSSDGDDEVVVDGYINLSALARAAIAAMREPTEEMLEQVVTEPTHLYGQDGRGPKYEKNMKVAVQVDRMVVRQRWKDMIDAALTSSEK